MSAAAFYAGLAGLFVFVALNVFIAVRLRARLLPDWHGSLARLGEAAITLGLVVCLAELLGLAGLIEIWSLLAVSALIAAFVWLKVLPASGSEPAPEPPQVPGWGKVLSLATVALVIAIWASFTSYSLDYGITNFDSVWYHLPFSAEMAQSGSVTGFQRPETVFLNWFYPQNSELVHALAMVFTGRDFVSIFINLGWASLALLAGWVVGRPYGRSHLTLLAVAVLMVAHSLVAREPGSAKNDIVAIALCLTSLAVLVNLAAARGRDDLPGLVRPGWGLALAGLAAGLAAGTKVTALAPVALVTLAVVFAAVPGRRLRVTGVWAGAGLIGGGYWYLKNLIASGNPLPQVENIGPVNLPGPERLQVGRPDFTVFHYIGDGEVWKDWFLPGLHHGFGDLWPLLLIAAAGGALLIAWKGQGRLLRALGAASMLAMLAYLVTPLTAAGAEGSPTGFAINLRFLIPALVMGLVLLPLLPVFSRRGPAIALAAVFSLLVVADGRLDAVFSQSGRVFGVAVAIGLVVIPAVAYRLWPRITAVNHGRKLAGAGVAGFLIVVAAVLMPLQSHYFDSRYKDFEPEAGLAGPYRWASGLSDTDIALAGSTAGFKQYGFYGEDLSNRITYVGEKTPAGGFRAIGGCGAFKKAVNGIGSGYLVTSPYLNFAEYSRPIASPEGLWMSNDPAAVRLQSSHGVTVWELTEPLTIDLCSKLPGAYDFTPGLEAD